MTHVLAPPPSPRTRRARRPAILILTFTSSFEFADEPRSAGLSARHASRQARRHGGSRFGVDAGHEHYKWWALSCTSLGMLLAATNSGTLIIALPDLERSLHTSLLALVWVILAYLIAATVLVLMAGRLSDLFGRKRAYVGGFLAVRPRLARRRLLRRRDRADPVAHPAGHRLGVPVRQRRRARHRRLPQASSSAWRWAPTRWSPRSASCSARCSAARSWRSPGTGCSGSTSRSRSPAPLWGALILRELAKPDTVRGYDVLGTITFVVGLTGLVLGVSRGGLSGWNDPIVIGGLRRRRRAAAAVGR